MPNLHLAQVWKVTEKFVKWTFEVLYSLRNVKCKRHKMQKFKR